MADRINAIQFQFQRQTFRSNGPNPSRQLNDLVAQVAADDANLQSQWNNSLVPLLSTVPITAFTNGLDGKTLYVDSAATALVHPTYYNLTGAKPNNIYEQFEKVYTNIESTRLALEASIAAIETGEILGPVIYSNTVTLSADGTDADGAIVGSEINSLGHADGIEIIPAVADKIIYTMATVINYTYAGAAYTGGSNVSGKFKGGAACTSVISSGTVFGAGSSVIYRLGLVGGAMLKNTPIILAAAPSPFTQPGSAAGTATVTMFYYLI